MSDRGTGPAKSAAIAEHNGHGDTVVHVVNHVHWDREWYRPFESFRSRLVVLVDEVCDRLESAVYEHFMLDGQTIAIEDYLEVRPARRATIQRLVTDGRLSVGPWYSLADMTLVSGESLVRNLLHGAADASALGGCPRVGYCPDMFGHPPDLPGVLTGFDIRTVVLWRGTDPAVPTFRWAAPNGSEVLAIRSAYYSPEVLWDPTQTAATVPAWIAEQRAVQPSGPLLLLNGGDHMLPSAPPTTPERGTWVLQDTDLPTHLDQRRDELDVVALPRVNGELRRAGTDGAFLLAGSLSTRGDVKRAHNAAQRLLERWAEPSLARALMAGGSSAATTSMAAAPTELLQAQLARAWRLLLSAQAHDSICGTSVDEVHRANHVTFDRTTALATVVTEQAWLRAGLDGSLAAPLPGDTVPVAVLAGHASGGRQPASLDLTVAPGRMPITVRDHHGRAVPFSLEDHGAVRAFHADIATLPRTPAGHRWQLSMVADDVPHYGWAAWTVALGDAPARAVAAPDPRGVAGQRDAIDDAGWVLSFGDDGTLSGTVKGERVAGLARLVDIGEAGDTYTHQPTPDPPVVGRLERVVAQHDDVGQRLTATVVLRLPTGLDESRARRRDTSVDVPVEVTVTKWRSIDRLDWSITLDNTVTDHRLSVEFDVAGADSWETGAAFSMTQRAVPDGPSPPVRGPGREQATHAAPMHTVCGAGVGSGRLTILSDDVMEATATRSGDSVTLGLTLLRCVGWLNRDDLVTRTQPAGPPIETPDAQMPGRHTVAGSLLVGETDLGVARAADRWRGGLRGIQLARPPETPTDHWMTVRGELIVSAVKPAHGGRGVVLRVRNPLGRPATGTIEFARPPAAVHVSDLDERDGPDAPLRHDGLTLRLDGYQVRTLRCHPPRR